MRSSRSLIPSAFAVLATLANNVQYVAAQVSTSCSPLNSTCPPDPGLGTDYTFYFNQTPITAAWETTAGTVDFNPTNGATFTINKQGDSPTIRTMFYYFFGRTEIWLKTSPGVGIISSLMMLSDDLDEIDWEFMGGNDSVAETNYFGKGVDNYLNAIYYPVVGGPQGDYHNYTSVWTSSGLQYWIDGTLVRTLLPAEANATHYYPQTPMRLSIGIWAGGDPSLPKGTREWAGGTTNYNDGPFNMYVKSCRITDYGGGSEYTYGDMTGSWQSIKVTRGNSTASKALNEPPPESLAEKWNKLSPVVRIVVYACAAGVGTAFLAFVIYYFIKQRRLGRTEARLAAQRMEDERLEMNQFRKAGVDPDSFAGATGVDVKGGSTMAAKELSPPSTADSMADEKAWGAGAAGAGMGAAAAMRSPMPLLREGAQSPRSPGPDRGMYNQSPAGGYGGPTSPTSPRSPGSMSSHRVGSPVGIPPRFNTPSSPRGPSRSFNSSPGSAGGLGPAADPLSRMRTPGPVTRDSYGDVGGASGYTRDNGPGYGQQGGGQGGSYWR